jgi:hypothetical protein
VTARLTVDIEDVDRFLTDPEHQATISGTIESDALGGKLRVEQGTFNQFVYGDDPWERTMRYRLEFRDPAGHPLVLEGEKYLPSGPHGRPWRDTTTLHASIRPGSDGAPVSACGELRITPAAFLRELASFRPGGRGPFGGIRLLLRYFRFFVGVCARVYLGGRARPASPRAPRSDDSQT